MMKNLIIFISIGTITFYMGYQSGKPAAPKTRSAVPITENICKIKCESLNNLNSTKEKYEKTKTFMPQAILGLLAAIGVQFTREQQEKISLEITESPENYQQILEENKYILKTRENTAQKDITSPVKDPAPTKFQGKTEKIKISSTELFRISKESNYVTKVRSLKKIIGTYSGSIVFNKGKYKEKKHEVLIEMDYFKVGKDKIDGSYFLQIRDEHGIAYSTNRGSGGNKNVRLHPTGILILEASPDSYLQFKNINGLNRSKISAIYIEKSEPVGRVSLIRE